MMGARLTHTWNRIAAGFLGITTFLLLPIAVRAVDLDAEPIHYAKGPADNVIERLNKRLTAGEIKIACDPKMGYLPSLLKALDVPQSSQILVFSKTSFQRNRISPATPTRLVLQ
jgi:hypothetical protein